MLTGASRALSLEAVDALRASATLSVDCEGVEERDKSGGVAEALEASRCVEASCCEMRRAKPGVRPVGSKLLCAFRFGSMDECEKGLMPLGRSDLVRDSVLRLIIVAEMYARRKKLSRF